jgi:hypothetical protein
MPAKVNKPATNQNNSNPRSYKTIKESRDFADTLDQFFTKNTKLFLYLSLFLSVLFSILLFDVKPGIGGDDSSYIIRTYNLVKDGTYPSFQGPMYPFILAPFIALFGIKLPLLKALSLIFIVLSIYFTYKAFEKKFPQSVLILSILLLSINYNLLFFSSQTYSEGFFIFVQSLFLWIMSRNFFSGADPETLSFKKFILPGFLLFVLAITRNIAYVAIAATAGYFLLNKQWRSCLKILLSFIIFFVLFEIIKRLIWGNTGFQLSNQGSSLLLKDFYNPALGKEDLPGFINRFFGNSDLYFSKHLFNFIGFRIDNLQISTPHTILAWTLLLNAFFWAFKKNKWMLLISVYTICICVGTFISVQTRWDQWRLIINVFPLILLSVMAGLYYTFKHKKTVALQIIPLLLSIIIFFGSFKITVQKSKIQEEILAKNLKGNLLYGYTPDWVNYIQMSKWAAKNTPSDKLTAVRKADISFLYGERKFYGITKVPSLTVDSFLKTLPDTAQYISIKLEDKDYNTIATNEALRLKIVGFVNGKFVFKNMPTEDGHIIAVLRFSKNEVQHWEAILQQMGFTYEMNSIPFIQSLKTLQADYAIYIPEMLIDNLKTANVRYLLMANLRANPNENTGNIITTLHRFVYFIQLKYPNMFRLVNTIGDVENAELLEILY